MRDDLFTAAGAAWRRICALVALVVAFARRARARFRRWPELERRPFACVACNVEYSDPRALGWHMHGHADVVVVAPAIAAKLRGADERRRLRAREELGV